VRIDLDAMGLLCVSPVKRGLLRDRSALLTYRHAITIGLTLSLSEAQPLS